MRRGPAAALIVLLAAGSAGAWTRDRLVLVVDNRSSNGAALAELGPVLSQIVASKGYDVVPAAQVAGAMRTAQLAPAGELSLESAARIREALNADAIVTVTVSFLLDARPRAVGPGANPAFGLRARMLTASGKVWRNSLGWIADDVAQPGPGSRKAQPKPTALACERLLWSMPRGRTDPNAAPVVVVEEIAPPSLPTSTRWEAPVERQRDFAGVAHFPLRVGRPR